MTEERFPPKLTLEQHPGCCYKSRRCREMRPPFVAVSRLSFPAPPATPDFREFPAMSTSSHSTLPREKPLLPWMKFVLRFVAIYNILAGLHMLILRKETYWMIGMERPQIDFPIQLVGILVALFGVGYSMVARNPLENRNVQLLGFWSKLLGSCLGTYYVARGRLPLQFVLVYFFADVIYLPPFYLILRRLKSFAEKRDGVVAEGP
jgi:hypothetical protein